MRHCKKGRKLNRTASHRKALFSNLASSLIINKSPFLSKAAAACEPPDCAKPNCSFFIFSNKILIKSGEKSFEDLVVWMIKDASYNK